MTCCISTCGWFHRLTLRSLLFSYLLLGLPEAAPDPAPPVVYVYGRADFPASNGGALAASGDFNGDGRPDFVAVSYQGNFVSILLGQPDGSFVDDGTTYAVGAEPLAVAVGDLNGDGKLDLAVVNQVCPPSTEPCPPGSVSILLGNGDGTFQSAGEYETAPDAVSVVIGDFNSDGTPDIAVAAAVSRISTGHAGLVSILLGNGDGTFVPHADFPAGIGVVGLVAGQFRGDGILDLVVDNHPSLSSHTVSLLQGSGDGTFQEPTNLTLNADPLSLTTGDFNGDGNLDLAVATGASTASILLGDGNGGFQSPVDYPVGFGPYRLIAADLNGDGNLDLLLSVATSIPSNGAISVLLGTGDGAFLPYTDYLIGTFGQLVAGDFNGDGKADVAVGNGGSTVSVLLGNGDGTLAHAVDYATGNQPAAVAAGDFNGDGELDLAVVNLGCACPAGSVSILLGNGDGTFGEHTDFGTGNGPSALAVGDFNGDGKLDLAVVNSDDDNVSILLGVGDGSFLPRIIVATGRTPASAVAYDFNADGNLDLAVTNSADGNVSILLGHGDGTFEPRAEYAAGPGAAGIALGDFDRDGRIDLAVANAETPITIRDQGLVSVLLGNGDGTFQNHRDSMTQSLSPLDLVACDFNGDGKLDLAATLNRDQFGYISILIGNGDGTFQVPNNYASGRFSRQIVAGDFNGDGKIDLAQAELGSNLMTLLKGKGDGTFEPQSQYGVGVGPIGIVMADFNGDNLPDAAVVNLGSNTVSVFVSGAP